MGGASIQSHKRQFTHNGFPRVGVLTSENRKLWAQVATLNYLTHRSTEECWRLIVIASVPAVAAVKLSTITSSASAPACNLVQHEAFSGPCDFSSDKATLDMSWARSVQQQPYAS